MKFISVLTICIIIFWGGLWQLSATDQEKIDFSEAIRIIDIWLEAQREYDRLPGISVAVVKDQEVIWSKGYGMADLHKKSKTTPATIYSICSISKLFTSIAIMQLRDAGKLRLDDRVADVLPWFNLVKVKYFYQYFGKDIYHSFGKQKYISTSLYIYL